ncbi:hypothetical protein J6590_052091 [Homalodisca vitripennis]|nr:hypothetical protein J6590_052091 [Homalodisca vitripennis]
MCRPGLFTILAVSYGGNILSLSLTSPPPPTTSPAWHRQGGGAVTSWSRTPHYTTLEDSTKKQWEENRASLLRDDITDVFVFVGNLPFGLHKTKIYQRVKIYIRPTQSELSGHARKHITCSGYDGYREITESSNVERGCCLDGWPLSDPVLASSPPARPLVVVRK